MSNKENLVEVFNNTLDMINSDAALKVASEQSAQKAEYIKGQDWNIACQKTLFLANVNVTTHKTFEAACLLREKHPDLKIGVLNFASATRPGGGVLQGASAQEECLCRCSTLYPSLNQDSMLSTFYQSSENALHTDDIIYSPDIVIFKDDRDYSELENRVTVDVITCAAPNLRENPTNRFNPRDGKQVNITDEELYKLHYKRAINILMTALAHNVEVIVLGAFGCGAFRNDPVIVSNAYKDALQLLGSKFIEVEFAIYCKNDYDSYNYQVFSKKFKE